MNGLATVLLIIFVLALVAVFVSIAMFNKLRRLDVAAQGAFAGIDTMLTKRADLIPNLVGTVKGARDFEAATLQEVVKARTATIQAGTVAEKSAADDMLTSALGRLFALAEAYPQLTATANFRDMQTQLAAVEGELQFARQFYNDSAVQLNTALRVIPSMWFARIAKVTERPMYSEPSAERREAPRVEF